MSADMTDGQSENREEPDQGLPPTHGGVSPVEDVGLEFDPETPSPPTEGPAATNSAPLSPPTDTAPFAASSESLAIWYTGRRDGQPAGPFTLLALKKQLASGILAPADLVWKVGTPNWIPARKIPDLVTGVAPPLPRGVFDRAGELLHHVDGILSNASFYRIMGRVSAGLGLITLSVSVVLSYWQLTWFTGAVLFLAAGLGSEAAGRVLDVLHRLESQLKEHAQPTKVSSDHGSEHD